MSTQALRRDVGRVLWIGFEGVEIDAALRRQLASGDAGGVTLFARNLPRASEDEVDLAALTALNAELHRAGSESGERLWISVDQEGGRVQRVRAPARRYPPMLELADLPDAAADARAHELGAAMGAELSGWGFDIDFAPVLDVHTNEANPVIGDRAFGREPEAAARRALAFWRGLAAAGIVGCGKHFPGHGDTSTDSHLTLPRLDHDLERLRQVELVPFYRAVDAGVPMIMTAHVLFSALDPDVPATLSRRVVTELLRGEIGFEGVIVSDDLDMKAIADTVGAGDAAVGAIAAGCDVLLLCRDPEHQEAARRALTREAEASPALRARIGESAERVRRLRPRC